jgi:hypothetical protein
MLEDGQRFRKLDRYKIAQLFHEIVTECQERLIAADYVARRHGIGADQVLAIAEEFKPEPLWRL